MESQNRTQNEKLDIGRVVSYQCKIGQENISLYFSCKPL